LERRLDAVFFEASSTKIFADDAARSAFRERWLGRYLDHDARFAHVALADDGAVAGYVVGSIEDPARAARFHDLGYFQTFRDLTERYPAHLHINLAPEFRGRGVGGELIARFIEYARRAGAPGIHVTTSRGARNVTFYERLGFEERGATGEGDREILFLAQDISRR
jgi:GNAT superfamily N-acetyltransferase